MIRKATCTLALLAMLIWECPLRLSGKTETLPTCVAMLDELPAGTRHRLLPFVGSIQHRGRRATHLRASKQPIDREHQFPSKNVCLQQADRPQVTIAFLLAQLECGSEGNRMAVPNLTPQSVHRGAR